MAPCTTPIRLRPAALKCGSPDCGGDITKIVKSALNRHPLHRRSLSSAAFDPHQCADASLRGVIASNGEKREELMQIDCGRSIGDPATPDEVDGLLRGRMKILGLDVDTIGREFGKVFDGIKNICPGCDDREACAIDLRHDPNALIWEAYCPNADVLNVLVSLTEAVP
jgi:hypothetical protein